MKQNLIRLLCLTLFLAILLTACAGGEIAADPSDGSRGTETAETVPAQSRPLTPADRSGGEEKDGTGLPEGVTIEELFSYSGAYVEDGSGAVCENICAVRLYNASQVHYQYLRFSLETPGGLCTFAASTLFAGARMTVLCEEKTPFAGDKVLSAEVLSSVPFSEPPSVHTDTLEITYADGFINVKNLTDDTLSHVYVYYKDTDGYGFLGGVTYRTSFGTLPAGETAQSGASNMRRATCRVVFATYDR